jgi:hypothetical protein
MICTHRIKPGCRISRFWSLVPVRDLLFRAKHLLFEANHTSDRAWPHVGGERVGELAAALEGGSSGCVEARAFHRLDIGQAFQV